ncbi:hypothetical protein ACFQ1S_25850, partial [Kibdelosporangium lantanae]
MSAQFGDRAPHDRPLNDRVSAVDEDNELVDDRAGDRTDSRTDSRTDKSTVKGKAEAVKDKAKAVFTDKPSDNDRSGRTDAADRSVGDDRSGRSDRTDVAGRSVGDEKSVINDEPIGDRTDLGYPRTTWVAIPGGITRGTSVVTDGRHDRVTGAQCL